jgi:hypothetical protein
VRPLWPRGADRAAISSARHACEDIGLLAAGRAAERVAAILPDPRRLRGQGPRFHEVWNNPADYAFNIPGGLEETQMAGEAVERLDGDALDSLAHAHVRTVDAMAGYETMVKNAEPSFRATAEAFLDLHRRHASDLAAMLRANGREPDSDGSFMGSINQLVVKARSVVDVIDDNVLPAIRDGEAHVLDALERVEQSLASAAVSERVRAMREELEQLLSRTAQSGPRDRNA